MGLDKSKNDTVGSLQVLSAEGRLETRGPAWCLLRSSSQEGDKEPSLALA